MDIKKTLINLVIALVLSPIIIYVVLTVARLTGAEYEMSHGDTWIIWVLMAILIKMCMTNKE